MKKNFKYATLAAVLFSFMLAGCNASWNPFRKKEPVVADPPLANVTTLDNTGVTPDPVRPDPVVDPPVVKNDPVPPVAPPAAGTTYTIKKKDTLWSIAAAHLGDGQRYREILAANPGLDAKKLAVGQTIKLPPK
ncbi:MAG: LysM peptidoglycan-binding domain-containing protein [Phycisphaerae bacterium]|nr:LysM peptidoglycan-binding domain-containing protein [Phycisphaerae bacterium]